MLRAVLEKPFRDRPVTVSSQVHDFIVRRCERSFASMASLAEALDDAAYASRSKVTIALAKQVLDRLDREND